MIDGEVGSFRFGESVVGRRSSGDYFYSFSPSPQFIIHHSSTRTQWFPCCGVPYLPLNKERIA